MKDWEGRSSSNEHGGPRNVERTPRWNPPVPPGHVEVVKAPAKIMQMPLNAMQTRKPRTGETLASRVR